MCCENVFCVGASCLFPILMDGHGAFPRTNQRNRVEPAQTRPSSVGHQVEHPVDTARQGMKDCSRSTRGKSATVRPTQARPRARSGFVWGSALGDYIRSMQLSRNLMTLRSGSPVGSAVELAKSRRQTRFSRGRRDESKEELDSSPLVEVPTPPPVRMREFGSSARRGRRGAQRFLHDLARKSESGLSLSKPIAYVSSSSGSVHGEHVGVDGHLVVRPVCNRV